MPHRLMAGVQAGRRRSLGLFAGSAGAGGRDRGGPWVILSAGCNKDTTFP